MEEKWVQSRGQPFQYDSDDGTGWKGLMGWVNNCCHLSAGPTQWTEELGHCMGHSWFNHVLSVLFCS